MSTFQRVYNAFGKEFLINQINICAAKIICYNIIEGNSKQFDIPIVL